MKIENSIKTGAAQAVSEGLPSPGKSGHRVGTIAATGNTSDTSANIQLSEQLQNIEKNLSKEEVFDAARVAEIKQAISEGRFAVNPGKVADGLLETVRDLIRRQV